jgi:sugar lactone lactonase YvrE
VARLARAQGVAVDAAGRRFVADSRNHTIRRLETDGALVTLAGLPGVAGAADGMGHQARFNVPLGLAADGAGGVFVADSLNHAIRHVDASGVTTTVAGKLGESGLPALFGALQAGIDARFNRPVGVVFDGQFLYIADSLNGAIRRMNAANEVLLFAGPSDATFGNPGAPVSRADARFSLPSALALAPDGVLWIADSVNQRIYKTQPNAADGLVYPSTGVAGSANFVASASAVAVDPETGDGLVFASLGAAGAVLYRVSAGLSNNQVTALSRVTVGDADGALDTSASFAGGTMGIAYDLLRRRLLVADPNNSLLREIDLALTPALVGTVTGQRSPGTGIGGVNGGRTVFLAPALDSEAVLVWDDRGAAHRIGVDDGSAVPIAVSGTADVGEVLMGAQGGADALYLAGAKRLLLPGPDGNAVGASTAGPPEDGPRGVGRFGELRAMLVDELGQAWVADAGAHAVRVVTPAGVIQRVAGRYGTPGFQLGDALDDALLDTPVDLQFAADSSVLVLDAGNRAVLRIALGLDGRRKLSLVAGNLDDPRAIAIDGLGRLYVAEGTLCTVVRIDLDGQRTTVAGQARQRGLLTGGLPGALALPPPALNPIALANRVGMRVIGDRLLLTMENAVVRLAPLPA